MKPEQIEAQLISTFFHTAGSFPIHDGCELMMRDLIRRSVGEMLTKDKISPPDVEKAQDTVREFTLEMKEVARGMKRDSIGEFTFGPVLHELRLGKRQGWWPFTIAP